MAKIQIKRTSVSGRTPNTTNSGNGQYIDSGEFALNLADGILYSSNGGLIAIGANNVDVSVSNSINIGNSSSYVFANSTIIGGNSYNNPALFAPNVNDPYWSFGSFANSTDFFMQTRFWGGNDTNHGFRIFDTNSNTVPFKIDGTGYVYFDKLKANNTSGSSGQVLTSNSTGGLYWQSPGASSVDTDAQYTWTNTHTFQNTITFSSRLNVGSNVSVNTSMISVGNATVNTQIVAGNVILHGSAITITNSTSQIIINDAGYSITDISTGSNTVANSSSIVIDGQYVLTSATAGVANDALHLGGVAPEGYQTTAGLASNVATLTSNNTSFVGSVTAANVVSNGQLQSNLSNYQTTAGLAGNVATLAANSASYLGTVAAASYVQNTDSRTLSGNLNFTGVNTYFSSTTYFNGNVTFTNNAMIVANGSGGANGTVLVSNGTSIYWSNSISTGTVVATSAQIADAVNVGNSTVNVSINSTSIFVGNSVSNTVVNTTFIAVSNTLSNSEISPQMIFVGNTSANTLVDLSGAGNSVTVSYATLYTNGYCVVNTASNHGVLYTTGLTVSISNTSVPYLNTANYPAGFLIRKGGIGSNSFSFNISPSTFASGARIITSAIRSANVITIRTSQPHQLTNNDLVTFTGITGTLYTFIPPTSINISTVNGDPSAFTYNCGNNIGGSISGNTYTFPTMTSSATGPILMVISKPNNGFTVGQYVAISGVTNGSPAGTFYPSSRGSINNYFNINKTWSIYAANSTTFTIKVGTKVSTSGPMGGTGTITGAAAIAGVSYDETAPLTPGSGLVIQSFTANTLGGGAVARSANPIGITISNSSFQVKATPNFLYIGSTSAGYLFTPTGGSATSGIP
jgi:cytoskeletal protein CcmA (bactofilin family)